jgi:hypothetical protein
MFKWISKLLSRKRKTMETQKLTDITRGMHHAATTTSAMVAQQYIMMVDQFFDSLPDGSIRAKMAKIYIDDEHFMLVPLVSLVAPKGLTLDKMHVQMSIKVTEAEVKAATSEYDNSEAERTSFTVSLSPKSQGETRRRSDVVDIEMQFSAVDPPEGIMRLIEQYTNRIQPVPSPEGEEAEPPESPMKIHIGEKVEKEKESSEQPEDRKDQE